MRVLFIEPPGRYLRTMGSLGRHKADFLWQPFDHLVAAGYMRKELQYVDFEILDARDESYEYVKKCVEKYEPDVVVFNTCVTSINLDMRVADIAKNVDESVKTVIMGQVVGPLVEHVMKNKNIDFAIIDPEPEYALMELIKTEFKPKTGVAYRENGKIVRLPQSPKINIEELGFPAHDKVDNSRYYDILQRRKPFALVYGSRGCRYGLCTFCSCPAFYKPVRLRSVDLIIKELKWITKDFGIRDVKWWDAEINQNPVWCKKLFTKMIREKIDLTWQANFRADFAPMWLLKLMKKAGCYHLSIGLESADQRILNNVKKGITPEMVKKVVKKLDSVGIDYSVYSLIGLPGETEETIIKTFKFVSSLGCAGTFGIAVPNPGTEFYEWIVRKGYLKTEDYSKFDTDMQPVYDYPEISSERMFELRNKLCRKHFFSIGFVMKCLRQVRNFEQLKRFMKTSVKIFIR